MSDTLKITAMIVVALAFFGTAFAITASVWDECRADHSFFYCLRLVSK